MTQDELVKFKDVLAELGVSRNTIRRLRKTGKFPEPVAVGMRKLSWRRSDINAWKEKGGSK